MKSCENCKCGHWQMFDNEYGRYPVVLCYLHKDCGGDEPYQILEDEWQETAERCKEYEDEQTQAETHRIAEEYKQELNKRSKEVKKVKAKGVLGEMIKNMDLESLAKTRKEMIESTSPIHDWLDKESRAYRDMREKYGVIDPVYLHEIEDAAYMGLMTGYNKAMKIVQDWITENLDDTEINWVDVYHRFNDDVLTCID